MEIKNDSKPVYDSVFTSEEIRYTNFMVNKRWGYFDSEGYIRIEPKYDEAKQFKEGLAGVKISDKWGFIDEEGQFIIDPEFSKVLYFHEGYAFVEKDDQRFVINRNGELINSIPSSYKIAGLMRDGLILIKKGDLYGYLDYKGDLVVNPQFVEGGIYSNGLACVNDGQHYFYVDRSGVKVIEYSEYMIGESFSQGLAVIRDPSLLTAGYININGEIIIEVKYTNASFFSEGVAPVKINGRSGYINLEGEMIIAPEFDATHPFIRGVALVTNGKEHQIIDSVGNLIYPIAFDYISMQSYTDNSDIIKILRGDKVVFINRQNGETVFEQTSIFY